MSTSRAACARGGGPPHGDGFSAEVEARLTVQLETGEVVVETIALDAPCPPDDVVARLEALAAPRA